MNSKRWMWGSALVTHSLFLSFSLLPAFSSSLPNCILCLSELGDHFLSYMPCWLLEFLAPRKLEGKKKSNIYRMPRLISWNGGFGQRGSRKSTLALASCITVTFPVLFFSPHSPCLALSLTPPRLPRGGSKILGAEQRWQDEVATHKLRQWLDSSLTVWRANNNAHCVIISRCCC